MAKRHSAADVAAETMTATAADTVLDLTTTVAVVVVVVIVIVVVVVVVADYRRWSKADRAAEKATAAVVAVYRPSRRASSRILLLG